MPAQAVPCPQASPVVVGSTVISPLSASLTTAQDPSTGRRPADGRVPPRSPPRTRVRRVRSRARRGGRPAVPGRPGRARPRGRARAGSRSGPAPAAVAAVVVSCGAHRSLPSLVVLVVAMAVASRVCREEGRHPAGPRQVPLAREVRPGAPGRRRRPAAGRPSAASVRARSSSAAARTSGESVRSDARTALLGVVQRLVRAVPGRQPGP